MQPVQAAPQAPGSQPPAAAAAWHGSPASDGAWYYQAPDNGTTGQNGAQPYGAANGNGTGPLPNGYGTSPQNGYVTGPQNGYGQPPGGMPQAPVNGLAISAPPYPPAAPQPALQIGRAHV